MSVKTIIVVVIIALAGALMMISFAGNVTEYSTFSKARETGAEVHIVARWMKDMPWENEANRFSFYLQDSVGNTERVVYFDPMPVNFETADKVVVSGKYNPREKAFVANQILMKCPSKYDNAQSSSQPKLN
ncbi:MAG: cytochrome c maturation protein CcmE [Bacteroidia bacterium]|nr:cytochrome c maturation protein CcmE [Bacteroidia bacterium]MDW8334059.1 cytochrome c maturation protein CcmE [Bacteroidia bacterium]